MGTIFNEAYFYAARLRRMAGLSVTANGAFDAAPDHLAYPPDFPVTPAASLTRLAGQLLDIQLYAAIPDHCTLDPRSGEMKQAGFHLLKFPAYARIPMLNDEIPIASGFEETALFRQKFIPSDVELDKPLTLAFDHFCRATNPGQIPRIYMRRVESVELVNQSGLYATSPNSLRFLVAQGQVIVTHTLSFPEIIDYPAAAERIRTDVDRPAIPRAFVHL